MVRKFREGRYYVGINYIYQLFTNYSISSRPVCLSHLRVGVIEDVSGKSLFVIDNGILRGYNLKMQNSSGILIGNQ